MDLPVDVQAVSADDRPDTDADRALRALFLLEAIDPGDHPEHAELIDRAQVIVDDLTTALLAETGRDGPG